MPYPIELPPGMQARIAADEKREAAEFEAEQYEKRERALERARIAEAREHSLIWRTGHDSATWRQAAMRTAAEKSMRDVQAEYGSEARRAVFVDGKPLEPAERSQPGTWTRNPEAELLKRARAAGDNPFMAEEVRRFDQRQRAAGKPVLSRSTEVRCIECSEENLSAEQSFMLHNDPSFGPPIPEVVVPDRVPASRKRSGTGWPELVR